MRISPKMFVQMTGISWFPVDLDEALPNPALRRHCRVLDFLMSLRAAGAAR
jgi:hypothetical protein